VPNTIDAATWQAVGLTLTVIGLLLSILLWRRRGAASGLRGVAWSLLPAAAGLTGTLRLLWRIGTNILDWAVHLVFSPIVWSGVVLAGVSLLLFVVTSAMRSRGVGTAPRPQDRSLPADRSRPAARPAPSSTGAKDQPKDRPKDRAKDRAKARPAVQDDDMDDIEAILRRHGIS
jgi:heme exporter protein D